jgi:methylmalonyl-CoA/ethylmalonyl-CoA epimerase
MKFDHIGIFVESLSFGRKKMQEIFEIDSCSKEFNDELMSVSVQFMYDTSGVCYEIVAPYGDNSPVKNVLTTKKNILNHVAYKVKNFDEIISKYIEMRCIPLGRISNAVAFNNARVIFFLTPLGMIIEFIEDK